MEKSSYRKLIAHGALMVGFMSTTSTMIIANKDWNKSGETPVSLGYDRVRFLAPVFFGDTINVEYRISSIDPVKRRATGDIAITNQDGNAGCGRDPYPEMGQERLKTERSSDRCCFWHSVGLPTKNVRNFFTASHPCTG